MCTVALGWPAAICRAMASALLIGMAKPSVPPDEEDWLELPVFAAVIMPMTWPALFASAPPESPCSIRALVCSMWFRSSVLFEPSSLAWIERSRALMMPAAGLVPPWPSALPSASTGVPRRTCEELPKVTGVSRRHPRAGAAPRRGWRRSRGPWPSRTGPEEATSVARTIVAPSITWLLVSTRPEDEMIIPVPSAVSPL